MSSVAAPSTASRLAPALADGIAVSMREDPRVYVWGEDVRIGVMGPTRGLADEFGPERVIDCPISEAAVTASRRWPAASLVGARSRSSKSTETIGPLIPIRA